MWNINTGECLQTLHGHTNKVSSVNFSLDGKILASSAGDHTTRLWDVRTSECRTIKLWDVKMGNCIKTLIPERPYERMNTTGIKGLTSSEKAALKVLGAVEDGE
ncbi:MAG: hypothetical protein RMY16_04740 [Nostoc sp. DedQUE12b]|uniref:WD40 repeat domain-containing protein n=1 Tax=Nostoc sp. DedQUE12b TaxID=3075398 RepID=UPI002AD494DB|nr:hypothetical protein [Nostoc sp. DedQUE12b]MDZ8084894.1 hypothetical protein [Nostoc sp. DedQUE12b]